VVPWALGLARRARGKITFNLVFAISAIVVMAIGVLAGSLVGWDPPLWMGVLGHEGGTLLVVANSLLLLGARGPRSPVESVRMNVLSDEVSRDKMTSLSVE
jgi:cation transport ATPase